MPALRKLSEADRAFQSAMIVADHARAARNGLIRREVEAGRTHAQLARELGMTRARVGQIALSTDKPCEPLPVASVATSAVDHERIARLLVELLELDYPTTAAQSARLAARLEGKVEAPSVAPADDCIPF